MSDLNTTPTTEAALPTIPQPVTRDCAVGTRQPSRDRVFAPGCAVPQTRPSGEVDY